VEEITGLGKGINGSITIFFHSHATHIFNDIKIPRLTTRKGEKGYEEEWKERCYTLAQMTGVDI